MGTVVYAAFDTGGADVAPMDPDELPILEVDWSPNMQAQGLTTIDESTWHPGTGLLVGDGVTVVTEKGKNSTPPAPDITLGVEYPALLGRTQAYVYTDPAVTIIPGAYYTVSNHVRMGSVMAEVTFRIKIGER